MDWQGFLETVSVACGSNRAIEDVICGAVFSRGNALLIAE
jgi:hypothetical protein